VCNYLYKISIQSLPDYSQSIIAAKLSHNQTPFDMSSQDSLTSPISGAGRARADRQTSDSTPTSRAAVAVACTNCRSRHLKCDGQQPCSRCLQEGLTECSYMKSRRGWKGPRKQDSVGAYSTISTSIAGKQKTITQIGGLRLMVGR
jgi:hypothetical protein